MKKIISFTIAALIIASSFTTVAFASVADRGIAAYLNNNFYGYSTFLIDGDLYSANGDITFGQGGASNKLNGTAYLNETKNYTIENKYDVPQVSGGYKKLESTTFSFKDVSIPSTPVITNYVSSYIADWAPKPNDIVSSDTHFGTLTINNILTIDTSKGDVTIVCDQINLGGASQVVITGSNHASLFINGELILGSTRINIAGSSNALDIYALNSITCHGDGKVVANLYCRSSDAFTFNGGTSITGNVIIDAPVAKMNGANKILGTVYAPASTIEMNGSARIEGMLVAANLNITGTGTIVYNKSAADFADSMYNDSDSGDTQDPEDTGVKINVGIVTPKKMSIRFEDGKIYNGGESITLEIGKTYRFQMCSNNWTNNTYDDNGNGVCGTVVYSVRVSNSYSERSYDDNTKTFVLPKGDPILRTDVNKCFMAYRYHFEKGDYNKQTGINQVVNTPLESLSVNLPLGSTIKSDAYNSFSQIDVANVFIERDKDQTISYTDYYWQH